MALIAPATNRKARQRAYTRTLATLPYDPAHAGRHLVAQYLAIPQRYRTDGEAWYSQAHDVARTVGKQHGLTVAAGAGILAALSPQCAWEANVEQALALAADPDWTASQTTQERYDKAQRIAHAEPPHQVLGTYAPKVRSFFANVLWPDDPGAVTVDRHAYGILLDDSRRASNGRYASPAVPEHRGAYTLAASVYRRAARALGVLPHHLQASLWLHRVDQTYNPNHHDAF